MLQSRVWIGWRLLQAGVIASVMLAVLSVRENGVGCEQSSAHRLCGVFRRPHTREEFEGAGISLSTVQGIVHRHGGRPGLVNAALAAWNRHLQHAAEARLEQPFEHRHAVGQ